MCEASPKDNPIPALAMVSEIILWQSLQAWTTIALIVDQSAHMEYSSGLHVDMYRNMAKHDRPRHPGAAFKAFRRLSYT
jgi:hypothetical protein